MYPILILYRRVIDYPEAVASEQIVCTVAIRPALGLLTKVQFATPVNLSTDSVRLTVR